MQKKQFPSSHLLRSAFMLSALGLLILSLPSLLTGCSSSARTNDGFEQFTTELFCQEVSSNTLTLHYSLEHPEDYPLPETSISLGEYTTDTAAVNASLENCQAKLHRFSYKKLSKENKLTYDILDSYLAQSLDGARYTLYDEPLRPLTGIQSQLPILLSEYRFQDYEDVHTYLALLKELPEHFDSLIAFETAKADAGLFMSACTADALINECSSFLLMGSNNYLLTSFKERIQSIDSLTDKQKEDSIIKNEDLITSAVLPAYEHLKNALLSLKGTGVNQNGLCKYPDGDSYYEYLVRQETGSARDIPHLQALTRRQMAEDLQTMQEILSTADLTQMKQSSDSGQDGASADKDQHTTLTDSNPSAILAELREKAASDFPAPPDTDVQVKYVQPEMESFLSPAFYMVPAIDNTKENTIYINSTHLPGDLELYTTLAHEGYPGHLYQNIYYAKQNPAPIRTLLNFGGYTEGWATYSEMISYYYAPIPKNQATLMQRNTSVLLGLYALADMGIHYDGWTLMDTVSFFRNYGITDTGTIEDIYDMIIANPANYLKYYIGYVEFLELKKEAIHQWGDDFSQKRFHEAVLEAGPAPFDILRLYVL